MERKIRVRMDSREQERIRNQATGSQGTATMGNPRKISHMDNLNTTSSSTDSNQNSNMGNNMDSRNMGNSTDNNNIAECQVKRR